MRKHGAEGIKKMTVAAMLLLGGSGMLYTVTDLTVSVIPVMFAVLVWGILSVFLFFEICRYRIPILLAAAAVFMAVGIGHRPWLNGAKDFWNHLAVMLGRRHGFWMPTWKVQEHSDLFLAVLLIVLAVICISLVLCLNRFLMICLLVLAAVVQILYGTGVSAYFFAVFFFAATLLFGNGLEKRAGRSSFLLIFAAILISGAAAWFLPETNKNSTFEAIQHQLSVSVERLRYGKKSTGLPEGDFSAVGALRLSEKEAFLVTMEKPASIYLRGFVGSSYSENGWKPTTAETKYASADLFYWLHRDGFFGQGQLAAGMQAFDWADTVNLVQVKNTGASRKYVYLPYEFQKSEIDVLDVKVPGDENVQAGGLRGIETYSFQMVPDLVTDYQKILDGMLAEKKTQKAQQYQTQEQYYNAYVYHTYTEIEENDRQMIVGCLGAVDTEGKSHVPYEKAKETILNYLSEKMTYAEDVSYQKENFLKCFLETERQGYSIHYATAAALMFRYCGIPARYVEGYLITPQDVKGLEEGAAISVPESNAHAWVEYYQDGAGWIPFEVTPPYVGVMEEAKIIKRTSGSSVQEQSPKTEEMMQDNYEKEGERGKLDFSMERVRQILFWVILAVLAAAIFLYIFRGIRIVQLRRQRFRTEDHSRAVIHLFTYMMQALFAFAVTQQNVSLAEYETAVTVYQSGEMQDTYSEMLALYRKARYGNEICSHQERQRMACYVQQLCRQLYRRCSWHQKLNWKFWKFMK